MRQRNLCRRGSGLWRCWMNVDLFGDCLQLLSLCLGVEALGGLFLGPSKACPETTNLKKSILDTYESYSRSPRCCAARWWILLLRFQESDASSSDGGHGQPLLQISCLAGPDSNSGPAFPIACKTPTLVGVFRFQFQPHSIIHPIMNRLLALLLATATLSLVSCASTSSCSKTKSECSSCSSCETKK